MDFREFSGKTVDDAIIEAATSLGIASSELEIEIVNKGTSGFLGLGSKPAVIKAKPKQEVKDEIDEILATAKKPGQKKAKSAPKPAAAPAKVERSFEEKPAKAEVKNDFDKAEKEYNNDFKEDKKEEFLEPAEIDDSIIDETRAYLEQLFKAMDLEATIDISLDKMTRTMNIDVEGPEMGIIIGKRGQTLDSLQYLISLFVNRKCDTYLRIKLDTENYRERRRETLENLAKNIAFKVKKSRRSFTLEPMNPYERRIIHSTLQGDKFVATKSEGEEPNRRVVIYPKKYNK